jgi:uncharacterized membrane protein
MTDHAPRTFTGDFKRFFLRGLVILLPSVLTLWIVVKAYQFVDGSVAQPINRGVRLLLVKGADHWDPLRQQFDPSSDAIRSELWNRMQRGELDVEAVGDVQSRPVMLAILAGRNSSPTITEDAAAEAARVMAARPRLQDDLLRQRALIREQLRRASVRQWWDDRWYMDLVGILAAIIAVYTAGRVLGGYLGRRLYKRVEGVITSLPVFKQVYPSVKQVVDFLFGDEQPIKFNRVVAVQYPRKGIWSVGFLTGDSLAAIQSLTGGEAVTVFIPSSPTPFTGYTITVPKGDVLDLALTVDEALRFAVSGGVLVPEHLRAAQPLAPGGEAAAAAARVHGDDPPRLGPNPSAPDPGHEPSADEEPEADRPGTLPAPASATGGAGGSRTPGTPGASGTSGTPGTSGASGASGVPGGPSGAGSPLTGPARDARTS